MLKDVKKNANPNGGYSYNVYDRAIARGMSGWQAEELAKAHQAKQDWEEAQQQQEFWREYMFMLEKPEQYFKQYWEEKFAALGPPPVGVWNDSEKDMAAEEYWSEMRVLEKEYYSQSMSMSEEVQSMLGNYHSGNSRVGGDNGSWTDNGFMGRQEARWDSYWASVVATKSGNEGKLRNFLGRMFSAIGDVLSGDYFNRRYSKQTGAVRIGHKSGSKVSTEGEAMEMDNDPSPKEYQIFSWGGQKHRWPRGGSADRQHHTVRIKIGGYKKQGHWELVTTANQQNRNGYFNNITSNPVKHKIRVGTLGVPNYTLTINGRTVGANNVFENSNVHRRLKNGVVDNYIISIPGNLPVNALWSVDYYEWHTQDIFTWFKIGFKFQ